MALPALLKASGATLLTTAAVTLVSFLTSVITARILGPEGRGLLSAALLIATLSASLALCGLPTSFVYHRGARLGFNYRLLLVASLLGACLLAVLLSAMGLKLGNAALRAESGLILFMAGATAIQSYFYTVSQLHHDLGFFNVQRIGLVVGNLLSLMVLLALLASVQYEDILLTQTIVMAGLAAAGMAWAARNVIWRDIPGTERQARCIDIWRYGASHHGTVVLGILLANFDKIALLRLASMAEFGIYALAFTTSRLIGAVQDAASTALYARFAGQDTEDLKFNVNTAFRVTFFPMLVMAAIGAALSDWLIPLVYGPAFRSMSLPFSILLFECVIGQASWTLAQRFNASGRPGLVFLRQFISVLPILLLLPFVPAAGAAIYLSVLLLIGATLRFVVTLCLYPLILKESVPRMFPERADLEKLSAVRG